MSRALRLVGAATLATVALLPVVLTLPATRALADEGTIREVDVSAFPTVRLTVSTDTAKPLQLSNVSVLENGVPVTVTTVEGFGDAPRQVDAVVAVDTSNSMAGSQLETALAAVRTFVAGVPGDLPLGIMAFSDGAHVLSPLTGDRAAVDLAVASLTSETSLGTALYDAVEAGAGMFEGSEATQHNLIVLTDGRNTTGSADLAEAVSAARDAGVNVFTVGLAGPETDQETLQAIADQTGGTYAAITRDDLDAVYASLARQLSQQVVVEYRSKAPYGAPVGLDVSFPGGMASTRYLTPAMSGYVGAPGQGSRAISAVTSPGGLAVIAVLTFFAVLNLSLLLRRETARRRRERHLRSRVVDQMPVPTTEASGPGEPATTAAWIPRRVVDVAERTAASSGTGGAIASRLQRAGWSLRVGEFLTILVISTAAGAVGGAVSVGPLGAIAGAIIGGAIPTLVLSAAATRRVRSLQAQLADTLMVVASSLRAGHSFLQSLDTATKEVSEPAASEFGRAMAEIRFGRDIDGALDGLVERVGSQDLEWAVTAIKIQRKVGGNLAEVLETVARTIRERETLRRQVRVLSAEGRLSAVVLTVLPIVIAAYLMSVNPEYLETLTSTRPGVIMLVTGGVLMVLGYAWMQRIVKLDV